jgi:hypothetical protein
MASSVGGRPSIDKNTYHIVPYHYLNVNSEYNVLIQYHPNGDISPSLMKQTDDRQPSGRIYRATVLHHFHPSRAEIINWTSTMFQMSDVKKITESFHKMVQDVERCVSSYRRSGSTEEPWIEKECQADEKLLELLHNTFVQLLVKAQPIKSDH